tara:strand:- start:361 stop:567 length:207 start_codon:yes stop_codon:yes gene_type:complete
MTFKLIRKNNFKKKIDLSNDYENLEEEKIFKSIEENHILPSEILLIISKMILNFHEMDKKINIIKGSE